MINSKALEAGNGPCPCGSGKKFKKYCIRKGIYDKQSKEEQIVLIKGEVN